MNLDLNGNEEIVSGTLLDEEDNLNSESNLEEILIPEENEERNDTFDNNQENLSTDELNRLSFNTINRILGEEGRNSIQQNVINISSQYQNILTWFLNSNLSFSVLLLILYLFQYKTSLFYYLINFAIFILFNLSFQNIESNPQLKPIPKMALLFAIFLFIFANFYFQPFLSKIVFLSFTKFGKEHFESIFTILYYVFFSDLILR